MPFSHSIPKSVGSVSRLHLIQLSVFPSALTGRLGIVALVFACLLACLAPIQLQAQNVTLVPYITTVAGNGTAGCTGDGGPASYAELTQPAAILDHAGNLYLVSGLCNTVRVVNRQTIPITVAGVTIPPGNIATVAGTGAAGYGGDGHAAVLAQLNSPHGAVHDSAGNLYIVDTGNNVIRKVDTNGIITTFAGNGIACTNTTSTAGPCGDGGAAILAQFNQPVSIAVDSAGNLYVGDELDYRVRKILTNGTITTVAGNGIEGYSGDKGPAAGAQIGFAVVAGLDSADNLYVADFQYNTIRKVDTGGTITTIAGTPGMPGYSPDGTPATSAVLNSPHQVVRDSAGTIYFADAGNNIIRQIDASGNLSTVVGNQATPCTNPTSLCGDGGPATMAQLSFPISFAIDGGGNFYIGDYSDNRIREVVNGPVPFFNVPVGSSNSELVRLAFNSTMTLSAQVTGNYSTTLNGCIPWGTGSTMCGWNVKFTPTVPGPRWGSFVVTDGTGHNYSFGLEGTGTAPALAFTPGVINTAAGNGAMAYSGDNGPATSAGVYNPVGVAVDNVGNLYIAENGNNDYRVRRVDVQSGIITTFAGTGPATGASGPVVDGVLATSTTLYYPSGLALDSAGNLYIADTDNMRVRKVDANGYISTVAGGGTGCTQGFDPWGDGCPATSVQLYNPTGVTVGSAGVLYIVDYGSSRIAKVDPLGIITTVAGRPGTACDPLSTPSCGDGGLATSAWLNYPRSAALDSGGNLYIADTMNYRIRKVDINGIITTIAGNGSKGNTPDGLVAAGNPIGAPFAVAVDAAGNVYFADMDNIVIRRVDTGGHITTVAGNGTDGYGGDNGLATSAQFSANSLQGLAVDNANLYIVDSENNRIRRVHISDPPSLTFPSTPVGTASAAQDVGIENVGNDLLNITKITTSANFTLQGADTSCNSSQTLAPSMSCILGIEFMPSTAATISGAVVLTDNALNVTSATQTILLNGTGIAKITPVITWSTPAPITYGTPLSATQLNATAEAPGTFIYTPAAGTVLNAGSQTLSVTFTPYDSVNYTTATQTVTINVNPAVLTVAANNLVVGQYSVGIPALTYSIYGFVNGDTATSVGLSGAPLLSTSLTSTSSAGTYPIVVTVGNLAPAPPPNYTLAFVNGTMTVSPNALNFMDNYFVTGDYSAGGVDLHAATPNASGMVTGTISIAGVPAGADIVNAFLYWQTAENPASSPSGQAVFNDYSITGSVLGSDLPLMGLSWGPVSGMVMRSYRAEVYPMLPRGANGIYQTNGSQTVQLPAPAQGASLVVIYRMLSGGPGGPSPTQYPLKAVVIHDGAWLPTNSSQQMIQTVQGFYDGVIGSSANVTTIYSTQAGWASNSKPVQLSNGSQYTDTEPTGAWSALVFSVPVNSSDNDGLLDAWKANGGYCDAGVNQGICNKVDPSWVALTGATLGKQDLFVQMDYMCSGVVSIGSDGVPTCDISGGGESLLPWVVIQPAMTQDAFLSMVQQPFLKHGINVHFVIGNAVPEETCTTDNPSANLFCVWPGEPGVVGWKGGLEQIKASPRNPDSCNTPNGDCTPRFQIGKKDSYHYVLFGHSVSVPSWSIQAGTLSSIQVLSGGSTGWAIVTTSAIPPDANGNLSCPTRVTIDGALATPALNGVYNVLPMSGGGSACTFTSTSTTFTIQTASQPPTSYMVTPGTYPNGLPEPLLAIYSSQTDTTSGYSDVGGGDSTVTLGKFEPTQAQLANVQAGTLMHELGHAALGLTHGGRYYPNGGNLPQYEPNCKPNHQSVMNYLFQFDLLGTPDSTHLYGYLDYSDRALSSLNEEGLIPWPGQVTPAYQNTKWFSYSQPPTLKPSSSKVATHCDGTPVGSTESPMWVWDGIPDPASNWGWTAANTPGWQDINFDKSYSLLDGYSDWDSIDPRQVGAFATDYVDVAALLGTGGNHGTSGIGGGNHGASAIGGGNHGTSGMGGGNHGTSGIGGGNHGASGIGGGNHGASAIGGGEINYPTAASYPRTPRGLTTTTSGNTATISWYAASFGKIQEYIVYGVTGSGITPIACVYLVSPENCPSNIPNQVQAPNPQATTFSYADSTWIPGVTYFVTTVDIGPAGTLRESTPAKQYQAPLTLSATSPLTYNNSEPLSATGGTTNGTVTYYVLSGPCSITSNQLTANSGTGSCVVAATKAGNSSYDPVASTPFTVTLQKATASVTPAAASKIYGAPDPVLTGTLTGFVAADNVTATYTRVPGETVAGSPYTISATLSPVTVLGNYNIAYNAAAFTISQASTNTALRAAPNPSNFGQSVSMTATVAPVAPGAGTPTGKVTFLDGSLTLGTGTLSSGDTATFTTSSLAAGNHNLTAAYGGDPNFSGSSSSALAEQVACGVLLSISPSSVPVGGTITVTGQVISCATTAQTVVVKFTLIGPLQPNKCGSTKKDIFTTPPFTLPAKTSKTVSFPFKIPSGTCTGTYSITVATLVNGTTVNTSTASVTITAH